VKRNQKLVLKDNQNKDSYTFVMDADSSTTLNLEVDIQSLKVEENTIVTDVSNLNKLYKKKKVLTNEDVRKASKGPKFSNPLQRNHSSVYE